MNLVKVDVVHAEPLQRGVDRLEDVLARQAAGVGARPIGLNTLVAITTSARRAYSLIARPRISSLAPSEYMSAVSKKLIPRSSA